MNVFCAGPRIDEAETHPIVIPPWAAISNKIAIADLGGDIDAFAIVTKGDPTRRVVPAADRHKKLVGPFAEHAIDAHHLAWELFEMKRRIRRGMGPEKNE